jgi:hypothetical protein
MPRPPAQRRSYLVLTSERGGKITCTKASGCTKFWPETLLTNGVTRAKAGSGVQASMLGTVTRRHRQPRGHLQPLAAVYLRQGLRAAHGARPGAHGLRRHLVCPERIRQPRDQPCLLSGGRWPGGQGAAWAASRTGSGGAPDTSGPAAGRRRDPHERAARRRQVQPRRAHADLADGGGAHRPRLTAIPVLSFSVP